MFDGNGRFAAQFMGSGLPKFASNNRLEGTPEENKAIVPGKHLLLWHLLGRRGGKDPDPTR